MEKRTLQPNKEDAGKRIDAWLSTVLENTTRSAAQRLLEDGCVEIGGKVPAKNYKLTGCEEVTVLMTHIGGYPRHYAPKALQRIQSARPKLFIAGHSHILKVIYDQVYDLLHINPGAAGCYGFHDVRTAIRFTIDGEKISDMEIGHWERKKLINENK